MIPRLEKIRDVLKRADIEGLIEIGAPKDEYDPEAEMIWQRISVAGPADQLFNEETVVAIIRRVWEEMFELDSHNLEKRTIAFTSVARELLAR